MLWRLAQPILCGRTGLRFPLRRLPPCARPAGHGAYGIFSSTRHTTQQHTSTVRYLPGYLTPGTYGNLVHQQSGTSASTRTVAAILSWPNGVQGPWTPIQACFPATQVEKRLMLDPSCHSKVDWPSYLPR